MAALVCHVVVTLSACVSSAPRLLSRTALSSATAVMDESSESPMTAVKNERPSPLTAVKPLVERIEQYRRESAAWDEERRKSKRAEIVDAYQKVFVPACGFVLANLFVYAVCVTIFWAALRLSGLGYVEGVEALQRAASSSSQLQPLVTSVVDKGLARVDESLGDLAIALLAVELAGPVIVAASFALREPFTKALENFLEQRGLGPTGAASRLEDILDSTRTRTQDS